MPQIPVPTTQDVFSTGRMPYQDIQANPNAFGANIGQAEEQSGQRLGQAGQELFQVAMRQKQVNDETASADAFTQFSGQFDELYGKYMSLQGKEAVDQLPAYQQQMQALQAKVKGTLTDAQQQMAFDQISRRQMMWNMVGMQRYADEQNRVYQLGVSNSMLNTFVNQGIKGAGDPNNFQLAVNSIDAEIDRYAQNSGMSPEEAMFRRQTAYDQLMKGTIQTMALSNPLAAAQFYHEHQNLVDYRVKPELEALLKTTTDNQYAAADGKQAFDDITARAQPSSNLLPTDTGGSIVKPYTAEQIKSLAGEVEKPSTYDDLFKKIGAQYNVPWQELKLRAVVESGLNPDQVSSQGAVGLMQLTPATAKEYGADPKDPEQSIIAAAKIIAGAGGTNGGDWAAADRTYYGGSATAEGKNTDQYVSNLAALRQYMHGPGAAQGLTIADLQGQEGAIIAQAQKVAEQRRPGDAVYAQHVVDEARRQWATQLSSMQNAEHSNMTQVMNSIQQGGYMSLGGMPPQLQQQYSQLTPQDRESIQSLLAHNVRASSGEYMPSDPALVMHLSDRINLPAGDPMKITNPAQITPYIAHGLNFADSQRLIEEMKSANTPDGVQLSKQVNTVNQTAYKMLVASAYASTNAFVQQHPELADEAAYRFQADLAQKVKDYQAQHKDVQSLFTPGSPDYVLAPARVASFMPTEAQLLQAKNGTQPGATPYPTATNPKTGQRLMYKDGQWQAMQ